MTTPMTTVHDDKRRHLATGDDSSDDRVTTPRHSAPVQDRGAKRRGLERFIDTICERRGTSWKKLRKELNLPKRMTLIQRAVFIVRYFNLKIERSDGGTGQGGAP